MHPKLNSWRHEGKTLRLLFDRELKSLAEDRLYWSAVVSTFMNYSSD